MLCEHGNIAPCVECDAAPLKAENEALRAQLKEAEEKGRVLMDMCRFWKARVAQMHEAAHELYAWCVENLTAEQIKEGLPAGHKIGQLLEFERPAVEAFILRKQAEAVEDMWDKVNPDNPGRSLRDEAQRLRQQAAEAERAGGEQWTGF